MVSNLVWVNGTQEHKNMEYWTMGRGCRMCRGVQECGDERPRRSGRFVRKKDSKVKSILRAILRNAGSHITDVTSVWGIPRGGVRM